MVAEKICVVSAEGEVEQLQPLWDKSLQLNSIRISDACFCPMHFPEHSHPQIKIAVPLERASI